MSDWPQDLLAILFVAFFTLSIVLSVLLLAESGVNLCRTDGAQYEICKEDRCNHD